MSTMASSDLTGYVNSSALNGTGNRPPMVPEGYESVQNIMRVISICSYVAILVLSSLGNTAIIGIVLKNKNMQTKANVLIVNMAVSDLIGTIFTVPRMIDVTVTQSYAWKVPAIIAEITCKIDPFLREVSCAVSIFSMVGIAVDRFYAIVIPMTNKPSVLKLQFLIPIICFISMASNAFYLYSFELQVVLHAGKNFHACFNTLNNYQEKIYDTFRFTAFIVVPLLVLTVLYVIIASKMTTQNIPGTNTEAVAKTRREQNRKIVKLSVIIVVSFAVCWLPYYIGLLLNAFLWKSKNPPQQWLIPIYVLVTTFTIMTYASFAINPYVCLIFSSNFRRSARRTLRGYKTSIRTITRRTTNISNTTRGLSVSNLEISLGGTMNAASNQGLKENNQLSDSVCPNSHRDARNITSNPRQESPDDSENNNNSSPIELSGTAGVWNDENCTRNSETHSNKGFQLTEM